MVNNQNDAMVAHMIHQKEVRLALDVQDILVRNKDKISPRFEQAVRNAFETFLRTVQDTDAQLMQEQQPYVKAAGLVYKFEG